MKHYWQYVLISSPKTILMSGNSIVFGEEIKILVNQIRTLSGALIFWLKIGKTSKSFQEKNMLFCICNNRKPRSDFIVGMTNMQFLVFILSLSFCYVTFQNVDFYRFRSINLQSQNRSTQHLILIRYCDWLLLISAIERLLRVCCFVSRFMFTVMTC